MFESLESRKNCARIAPRPIYVKHADCFRVCRHHTNATTLICETTMREEKQTKKKHVKTPRIRIGERLPKMAIALRKIVHNFLRRKTRLNFCAGLMNISNWMLRKILPFKHVHTISDTFDESVSTDSEYILFCCGYTRAFCLSRTAETASTKNILEFEIQMAGI